MPIIHYTPSVNLVSVSQAASIDGQPMTAEQLITYCARVSNPSNQLNHDTAPKLLAYCIKHKHWSIFEMADMTVEIVTSRAIAAQILRHRSANFQEQSQRYMAAQNIYMPELRVQDLKNRQNSYEAQDSDTQAKFDALSREVEEHLAASESLYDRLLEAGVAKESARGVLPLNTQTRLYMKMSVRGWIHYLQVRCGNGTQKEHQDIAFLILDIFKEQFPNIWEAVQDTIPTKS